jgi:hypothetical protein
LALRILRNAAMSLLHTQSSLQDSKLESCKEHSQSK